jgi:hypothetical protein
VFNEPTVYQERNKQCLVTNLEKEIIGYRHTGNLLRDISNWRNYLPAETLKSYKIYVETMINKEI